MKNNLIQNEIDVITEIFNSITYCQSVLEDTFSKPKISKIDKQFAINAFQNETNRAINTALLNNLNYNYFDYNNIKNKILPENYLKPDEQVLDIVKNINKLNKTNLTKLESEIKTLLKGQASK